MGWTARALAVALLAASTLFAGGCTAVTKQEGIFEARGIGLRIVGFAVPRTNYETVQDKIVKEVGLEARVTNVWRTAFLRPWYNFLYPILGVEWIEVYGTY